MNLKNIKRDIQEIYIYLDGYDVMSLKNRNDYYDIYNEFNQVNKFRKLKSIEHHGNNRLDHIKRVAKMSFLVSKKLKLDYVSCTRGAILHDFFTLEDIDKRDCGFNNMLANHPRIALNNSLKYFNLNDIEKDVILTHMYPVVKGKPHYKEAKVVNICDKLVSFYEFFKYQLNVTANVFLLFILNMFV